MRRQLLTGFLMLVAMTVLVGLLYPLAVFAVSQAAFSEQANGSIVEREGVAVGSALIGQAFEGEGYFQPRPSAAGDGYDGLASAASNLGPTDEGLISTVAERAAAYRELNGLAADAPVPVDAVTASASGLDPHISVANATLQADRVAKQRGVAAADVVALIESNTAGRPFGVLGEETVNVLELNLALDRAS